MDEFDVDSALQVALDRLTLLNQSASALSSTLDAVTGIRSVCRVLVPALADWCAADLLDEDGVVDRVCVTHRDADMPVAGLTGRLARVSETSSGPLARVLRGAGPVLLSATGFADVPASADPLREINLQLFGQLGGDSVIVAPLRARRRVLGALTLVRDADRTPLGKGETALVEDLTHRIALAVDNARLHTESQNIAERLQRSLLPDLPHISGLQITGRYESAAATAQVGGDWYDCFRLPNDDITLIIGDVTGHDLHAAVTMSQMRNMLRGIACDRQEPPGKILHRLDMAVDTLYSHQTATCAYALLRGTGEGPYHLDWALAGHPPPLLVTDSGDTVYLQGAHGTMLGADPNTERTSATLALPDNSTLLLYTDGLIERRGESLDQGLTRLRQHAAALVGERLDAMCDELLAGLAVASTDDVALLAVRLPSLRE
ncbi:GAF domain-containing SpoIIE family protein phosphatase [Streptomyces sp. NPDC048489]|uniref:PP2C family protein-serine/threonine phosphatase n=1 Tax=Streptomyces sp. NPDC048489 TaxID=3154504 RepID=UPI00341A28E6